MKCFASLLLAFTFVLSTAFAATPEQEKAFLDAYKKALEAGDTKTLAAFLYTEGAQPEQIAFFQMMQVIDPGAKVKSVELITPSAADMTRLNKPMTMPDGKSYVMGLTPTKQLVVITEMKSGDSSSTSTSKSPVAEKDGKLVIPVPVPEKK